MLRRVILAIGLCGMVLAQAPRALAQEHGEHVLTPGEERAEAVAAKPELLELRPPLAVATLIVFGLLLAVLWKFAWGPLSKALHDREHNFQHILDETEKARLQAESLLAEHRKRMAEVAEEVRGILEEARRDAAHTGDEIVKKAQSEAEAQRKRAETEIGLAKDQALKEIWTQSAEVAVAIAGRVLNRELKGDEHRRLVDLAMAELPAPPKGKEGMN